MFHILFLFQFLEVFFFLNIICFVPQKEYLQVSECSEEIRISSSHKTLRPRPTFTECIFLDIRVAKKSNIMEIKIYKIKKVFLLPDWIFYEKLAKRYEIHTYQNYPCWNVKNQGIVNRILCSFVVTIRFIIKYIMH